ncbi:cytochrome b/b6 domain-containing protein, partial [Sulfurospirillum arcachonense]|uniref:cytochrome b/b6 domain-containing protein n=1 Tax=Sulfurospirillum arcachonense TaxID=57666 RepID=UPI00056ABAF7
MIKSYIWSIPTRVFHWLFALLILAAFLTDEDSLLYYHALIGYGLLFVVIFRILWGFIGPKFSRFKDFPLSKNEVKDFLAEIFNKKQKHVGHNPLASFVMISMFVVCVITIFTGVITFGADEGKGIVSFLNNSSLKDMKLLKEVHELFANLFIALIVAHLAGVVFDRVFHTQYKTLNSIFDGYKMTDANMSISLNIFQKISFLLFVIVLVSFIVFSFMYPNNILVS